MEKESTGLRKVACCKRWDVGMERVNKKREMPRGVCVDCLKVWNDG